MIDKNTQFVLKPVTDELRGKILVLEALCVALAARAEPPLNLDRIVLGADDPAVTAEANKAMTRLRDLIDRF